MVGVDESPQTGSNAEVSWCILRRLVSSRRLARLVSPFASRRGRRLLGAVGDQRGRRSAGRSDRSEKQQRLLGALRAGSRRLRGVDDGTVVHSVPPKRVQFEHERDVPGEAVLLVKAFHRACELRWRFFGCSKVNDGECILVPWFFLLGEPPRSFRLKVIMRSNEIDARYDQLRSFAGEALGLWPG